MATGDGQPTACIKPGLPCWTLGVPTQEADGSRKPAEVGVSVGLDEGDDASEEDKGTSPASFRGCSWTMES